MTAFLNPLSPHIQICRITVSIMTLRFNSDGSFRVLQLADIQDGPNVRKDTIRLIEAAIHEAHPDLIVFTGDQIRGYDPAYIDTFLRRRDEKPGTHVRAVTEFEAKLRGIKRHPLSKALLNTQPTDDNWTIDGIGTDSPKLVRRNGNGTKSKLESWAQSINSATMDALIEEARQKVRDTFAAFLGPALEARIPFAATYGNHDFQCGVLADDQDDIYREFSGCMNPVAGSSPLALEPGTFALPIEASDGSGRIAMSVMMVNSGDYAEQPANDANNADHESIASYAKYASNSRGWDLADSDGYGTPSPEAIEWLRTVQCEFGARNGDGRAVPAIAFQHIPPQEFYDCLRRCRHTRLTPWKARASSQGTATCWITTYAGQVHVSAKQSAARTTTSAKCRPCARPAAILHCSAGMTIKTRSSGTCMTSTWDTHRPADSNPTARSRDCAAFACSNSTNAIRKVM